jgi:hypothetical protein
LIGHIDLQHQDGRGDQQHTGDGVQRGVDVLDDVVGQAAKIAGHDAEDHRRRQHHQGGQRADHEPGADALQALVEHVLADLVGAQDVILGGQLGGNEREHQHQRQGDQSGAPGNAEAMAACRRASLRAPWQASLRLGIRARSAARPEPDGMSRRAERRRTASRQEPDQPCREQRPKQQPLGQAKRATQQ